MLSRLMPKGSAHLDNSGEVERKGGGGEVRTISETL